MKLGKRLIWLAATTMMFAAVPAFGVGAQAASGCTLSAADCGLLDAATANVAKETSFVQDFEFNATITSAGKTMTVKAAGSGPFGVDTKANMKDPAKALDAITLQVDISGSADMPGSRRRRVIPGATDCR